MKALKTSKQHVTDNPPSAGKSPVEKPIPWSTSNGQTGKNLVIDREESPESQPTILQKIDVGPPERSQTHRKKRDYASVATSKSVKIPDQPWTKDSYGIRKSMGKQFNATAKKEQRERRILFQQNVGQQKSEADLMLALNEAL